MLTEAQIHKAHDVIQSVVLNPKLMALAVPEQGRRAALFMVMETLCWVLNHERGNVVTELVTELQEDLHKIGYVPVPADPS